MAHTSSHAFDAFYADARERLLLQAFALTGDLPAARTSVRDAFVVAWHHWPKARAENPEAWVRPYVWRHARRRHSARWWRRDRSLGHEARATLDALGRLGGRQRRLLLLDHLAREPLATTAREVALDQQRAERELTAAGDAFAAARGVALPAVRTTLEALGTATAGTTWPPAAALRRSGAGRRRTQTAAGAVGAAAALLVCGSLVVGQGAGEVRPTLQTQPLTETEADTGADPAGSSAGADAEDAGAQAEEQGLDAQDVLDVDGVRPLLPRRTWLAGALGDNTEGNGLVVPCQRERFADPRGVETALRRFITTPRRGQPDAEAAQLTELSGSDTAAVRTYRRTLSWYAGCTDPRTRLVSTHRLPLAGDAGMLFVLRTRRPATTMTVAVTRSGRYTHTLARIVGDDAPRPAEPVAAVLGTVVDRECGQEGSGSCAGVPLVKDSPPLPVRPAPAMLSEVDLPAATGVRQPWAATDPAPAKVNPAATGCDETAFRPLRADRTRTFLVPQGRLPDAFGLAQTVGVAPGPRAAHRFVERVRSRLSACAGEDGTEVRPLARTSAAAGDLSAWMVTTEVSDERSLRFMMAVVRRGPALTQLGFVPAGDRTIPVPDFLALARRAQERLAYAPDPKPRQGAQQGDNQGQKRGQQQGGTNQGS